MDIQDTEPKDWTVDQLRVVLAIKIAKEHDIPLAEVLSELQSIRKIFLWFMATGKWNTSLVVKSELRELYGLPRKVDEVVTGRITSKDVEH